MLILLAIIFLIIGIALIAIIRQSIQDSPNYDDYGMESEKHYRRFCYSVATIGVAFLGSAVALLVYAIVK